MSTQFMAYYTLAEKWHCGGSSQTFLKRGDQLSPGFSPQASSGKHSIGPSLPLTGLTWWAWCCLPGL